MDKILIESVESVYETDKTKVKVNGRNTNTSNISLEREIISIF